MFVLFSFFFSRGGGGGGRDVYSFLASIQYTNSHLRHTRLSTFFIKPVELYNIWDGDA